jgi:hypothetical protein
VLPNSITLTDQFANDHVLTKRSEQNGTTVFTGTFVDPSNYTYSSKLEVRHTSPDDPLLKGSHLLKLSVNTFDATGTLVASYKAWTVQEGPGLTASGATRSFTMLTSALDVPAFADEFFAGSY